MNTFFAIECPVLVDPSSRPQSIQILDSQPQYIRGKDITTLHVQPKLCK